MDYKNTVNLPRTDFPMKADLVAREPQRLEQWHAANLYGKIQHARAGAEKFVLHDGPPFANGDVHIGTALNKILKDIIVKFQTVRGRHAPYVPGWDCHGLPIEFKVTQEMRKSQKSEVEGQKSEVTPAEIRQACEAYARRYIDLQRAQFKRLGVLGDWENPYLTLHKEYEADELRLFADIVEKGFVYRGKKPVYWSIPARTALAEAEVEYKDHVSQSIYVKFPVVGMPGTFILIWTTTPWTLPANLAVAYNSTFHYAHVRVGGESYILSNLLLSAVAEKCGWESFEIVRHLDGDHLKAVEYQHPFCARTGRLFAGDEFVENSTGTGFVHIAPGHGLEDYGLGLRQQLPIYSPVDDDGRLAWTNDLPREQQMPAEMVGKSILEKHGQSEANEAVLHELRGRGALAHQENYHHSYPHCWRSKTPVIFRAMDQWFIRIDHPVAKLRLTKEELDSGVARVKSAVESGAAEQIEAALADLPTEAFRRVVLREVEEISWIPDWGRSRIEAAVKARPDWCISRQRAWGVPIPAFYDEHGHPILDARVVRLTADLVQQHGSNMWFEKSAPELWAAVKPKDWDGPEAATKSNDTLDVWIDSGSSSRAVLMRRSELIHAPHAPDPSRPSVRQALSRLEAADTTPEMRQKLLEFLAGPDRWIADLYLEGSDQHRGWFQSSLLLSLAGNGAPPYRTVLTHGFMVDEDREKISKSKQGQNAYEKPQTSEAYVNEHGADVVRLWVASQDFRSDIVVSQKRMKTVGETYRLIRNALRYQLSNLFDFAPERDRVSDDALTGLDRWILGEMAGLEADVFAAYESYDFHAVYQRLSQFAAVELSAIYHDVVKDRLYTDVPDSRRRRSTQTTLHRLVTGLCQMLSPIVVFTSDEAWEFIPGRGPGDSVHLSTWKPGRLDRSEAEQSAWRRLLEIRALVLPELEKERQAKRIGKALEAKVTLSGSNPMLADGKAHLEALRELLNVSQLEVHHQANGTDVNVTVSKALGQKCERCWHWEEDVGATPEHLTICGRCVEAVQSLA